MAFQISPGVNVSEVDLTTVVPSVSTTAGAFAGAFVWGPANKRVTINNEVNLVERFGKPDANTYESFFTAANFLAYGNNLTVVRAANTTSKQKRYEGFAALSSIHLESTHVLALAVGHKHLPPCNNFRI